MDRSPDRLLRVALLSYRAAPHSGGQGVYVRHLSRALAELGHEVEVLSGPPYPDLFPGVALTRLPSLDLYRPDDLFRTPAWSEFRSWIDVYEFGAMCVGRFPEPLTFSLRADAVLRRNGRFDVVHDNQSLGYGIWRAARRVPTVATIHHPIQIDHRLDLQHAADAKRRRALERWYAFTRMQRRVAPKLDAVIAPSDAARRDVVRDLGVAPERIRVVPNGVDSGLFRPLPHVAKVTGRIITTASADVPLKGQRHLIEALAKLRTERDADLVVIGPPSGDARREIARLGVDGSVRFEHDVDWSRLVELYAEAEVAVVPSLYEGFSLPAAEAMSCGVSVVATTAGALPEVVGVDGTAGILVPPGDAGALKQALADLLADGERRDRMARAARARAIQRFSWRRSAEGTVEVYRDALRVRGC